MLESIRKRSRSIVIQILFGLLILSFVAWGVGDFIRGSASKQTVATVGPVEITPSRLNDEFRREVDRLRQILGGAIDSEKARAMGIGDSVLQRLIERTLLSLGAAELGLMASDDLVRQEIQSMQAFRDEKGEFDRGRFQQLLQSNGLTEKVFASQVRNDLIRWMYIESLGATSKAPSTLAEPIFKLREERRKASAIKVAAAAMSGIAEPTETELAAFHQDNAARFTAPEYRKLSHLALLAGDLVGQASVAEEKLREAYEERVADFDRPEQRTVEQMVLKDEATAHQAAERIAKGEDFAAVAKDLAGMAAEDLSLGGLTREDLLPELADVAFGLRAGATGGPVRSPLGWHLLRVSAIEPAHKQAFEDVREDLAAALGKEAAIDLVYELANKLEDLLGGGATLEEAAQQMNLKLARIEAVDRQGRDPAGNPVKGLPAPTQYLETAFATNPGSDSLLTEAGNDGYFILRVDGVTPPALRPLDMVRAKVTEAWKQERRAAAAADRAKALADRLGKGGDLAGLAAELGTPVIAVGPLARTEAQAGKTGGLPQDLATRLFEAEPGAVLTGSGEDGAYVARLETVKAPDPAADAAKLADLRTTMGEQIAGDMMTQLVAALRQKYGVQIYQKALNEAL